MKSFKTVLTSNREAACFVSALNGAVSLPQGRSNNRTEAVVCKLLSELAGSKPHWLGLYGPTDADWRDGRITNFGNLQGHD
jgi:hypothetical protein